MTFFHISFILADLSFSPFSSIYKKSPFFTFLQDHQKITSFTKMPVFLEMLKIPKFTKIAVFLKMANFGLFLKIGKNAKNDQNTKNGKIPKNGGFMEIPQN